MPQTPEILLPAGTQELIWKALIRGNTVEIKRKKKAMYPPMREDEFMRRAAMPMGAVTAETMTRNDEGGAVNADP